MDFLKELKIKETSTGSSTGQQWMHGNGKVIKSYSPVDGKLIASVTATDKKLMMQLLQKPVKLLKNGKCGHRQNEVKW